MEIKKFLQSCFTGMAVATFIMQIVLILASFNCGFLITYIPLSEEYGTDLQVFIKEFIIVSSIGFLYGAFKVYLEYRFENEKMPTKIKFTYLFGSFILVFLWMCILPAILFHDISLFKELLIGPIVILVLFIIAYLVTAPIFDRIDKELVDELNKKIKEVNKKEV